MTDIVEAAMHALAAAWLQDRANRLRISPHDPVAETLAYCANQLERELTVVAGPGAMRTVEQYAEDHSVVPPTVRKWIANGELEAVRTPHGWRIPRTARRVRRKRSPESVDGQESSS